MQIALEKEFQAKEKLMEENTNLKHDLDARNHKINELQIQQDTLNKELAKYQTEIKQLKDDLNQYPKNLNSTNSLFNHLHHSHHANHENLNQTLFNSSNGFSNAPPSTDHLQPHCSLARQPSALSTASSINNNMNTQLLNQPAINLSSSSISSSSNPNYKVEDVLENSDSADSQLKLAKHAEKKPIKSSSQSTATTQNSHQNQHQQPSKQASGGHKFEVVSFQTIERCEYCCGILYGICRQAVRCDNKGCNYLCHPKCRQYLPTNCPININQRVQLKGVDFTKGIGTLMQGSLKVPKLGGVKKGWQDHYVFLSNARLFVCAIVDSKPSLIPALIVDIKDPNFSVGPVSESDVIHASKRDIPCILKVKLKHKILKL